MYTTGSGSILLRAKVDIEYEGTKRRGKGAGAPAAAAGSRRGKRGATATASVADAGEEGDVDGKALIVVTEMPYQTNKVRWQDLLRLDGWLGLVCAV
jgi:DNA gyrase/topoisomerase IV subunit A